MIRVLKPATKCGVNQLCWPINVIRNFKGTLIRPTILKTANQPAACGLTSLRENNVYFVATDVNVNGAITVGTCNLYEDWTKQEIRQTRAKFYNTIKC